MSENEINFLDTMSIMQELKNKSIKIFPVRPRILLHGLLMHVKRMASDKKYSFKKTFEHEI